jgi:hypothetical protein
LRPTAPNSREITRPISKFMLGAALAVIEFPPTQR